MAAVPDCFHFGCSYHNKKKLAFPIVGRSGLNSGIIFMRLDRMREFKFEDKMMDLLEEYKSKLVHPEQDLMSILFSYYPGIITISLFKKKHFWYI
jgi:lipopolysaccharide biosynthesis glycosyltransferase